ncbi:hypothetical protein IBT47_01525 [Erwinia sp. S43]|uniref:hypothetical protein n=1 Tax=Erwinia sp. S43 TaxID=2769339 RepID=UPI00190D70A6|nr:hypothetical protein [Erwinia sp. S43]MBK0030951.1 hypothetical protein [Erwinia sp. S43]
MNVVAWNGAIAAAGISGGILLDNWGAPALPPALILLLAVAFVITWRARQYGFRKGARMGH